MAGEKDCSLHGDLPVALDEHEQDVLAAQTLEEPGGGRVAIGIVAADQDSEASLGAEVGLHGAHLVGGETGPRSWTRCGRPRPGRRTTQQSAQTAVSTRERLERTSAVSGRNPRQPADRQRRDDQRREAEHGGGCDREVGVPVPEGVAHRPDADREIATNPRPG